MLESIQKRVKDYILPAFSSLIDSKPPKKFSYLTILWLAALYLLGIFLFGHFFNWGNFDFMYHDWAEVTGPRLQALVSAIHQGVLPLNISDAETFHFETTHYMAVADSFLSPQYLLLAFLPLTTFTVVNVWFLYTLGFLGLLVLYRKLRLSAVSFTFVFLLFNFNGGILAHYSVGHTTWGGYFLFPWVAWLIFRLIEGDHSWLWTGMMALLCFFIWLQGSFHQFVWILVLLAAVGIFAPKTFWTVIRTGVATFLVCAFRLLPCILEYSSYKASFQNGYPSLYALWINLVNLPDQVNTPFFENGGVLGTAIGEWELASFIGLLGALFLIYFGIYRGLLHREAPYRSLLAPLGVIFLLSMGQVLAFTRLYDIPLLNGERVSSRMFSLVLAFGLILAAERFQRGLDNILLKREALLGSLLALGIIGFDLMQDYTIWQISHRDKNFWIYFTPTKWFIVNNYTDTGYIRSIWVGGIITIISIFCLAGFCWREWQKKKKLALSAE